MMVLAAEESGVQQGKFVKALVSGQASQAASIVFDQNNRPVGKKCDAFNLAM